MSELPIDEFSGLAPVGVALAKLSENGFRKEKPIL